MSTNPPGIVLYRWGHEGEWCDGCKAFHRADHQHFEGRFTITRPYSDRQTVLSDRPTYSGEKGTE